MASAEQCTARPICRGESGARRSGANDAEQHIVHAFIQADIMREDCRVELPEKPCTKLRMLEISFSAFSHGEIQWFRPLVCVFPKPRTAALEK